MTCVETFRGFSFGEPGARALLSGRIFRRKNSVRWACGTREPCRILEKPLPRLPQNPEQHLISSFPGKVKPEFTGLSGTFPTRIILAQLVERPVFRFAKSG